MAHEKFACTALSAFPVLLQKPPVGIDHSCPCRPPAVRVKGTSRGRHVNLLFAPCRTHQEVLAYRWEQLVGYARPSA